MAELLKHDSFLGCDAGCEHRTTGSRAWCFDCHEWCYPDMPCVRGEVILYRWWLAEARAIAEFERDALNDFSPLHRLEYEEQMEDGKPDPTLLPWERSSNGGSSGAS